MWVDADTVVGRQLGGNRWSELLEDGQQELPPFAHAAAAVPPMMPAWWVQLPWRTASRGVESP